MIELDKILEHIIILAFASASIIYNQQPLLMIKSNSNRKKLKLWWLNDLILAILLPICVYMPVFLFGFPVKVELFFATAIINVSLVFLQLLNERKKA